MRLLALADVRKMTRPHTLICHSREHTRNLTHARDGLVNLDREARWYHRRIWPDKPGVDCAFIWSRIDRVCHPLLATLTRAVQWRLLP